MGWLLEAMMATNLELDDELIDKAKQMGGHKTKRAAVTAALQEYVGRRQRRRIQDLFGTVGYDPDCDYKNARHRAQAK